jgi:Spy/CpxP family protein refolding chaperone
MTAGSRLAAALIAAFVLSVPASWSKAGGAQQGAQEAKTEPAKPIAQPPKLGLSINDSRAFQGYTLMAPLNSTRTYLLDMQGKVVRTWESDCSPALCAFLLENGHVLRPGSIGAEAQVFGPGPGVGGRIQEFTWDGGIVWDFHFYNARQLPHHDITPLPNGNVLLVVADRKTAKEALAAGRRPELTGDSHLLPDSLIEIRPTGRTTGEVVWEWHLWDHVVQDFDKTKPDYGNVAEHPELVDLNYGEDVLAPAAATKAGQDKLKSIGYVGAKPPPGRAPRANPDWTHANGVNYNPELDQVMISVHNFSEFWIIDHSTTTAEAAGHKGGRSGKGGDLLYRWGNPRTYRAGTKKDQRLFAQHNAHWIPRGYPGEGHVLVFNNGNGRPDGTYSTVDELVLPVDSQGHYVYQPGTAFGPEQPLWSYRAPNKTDFYSFFISGAHRLPNGNTLICSGANGIVFEVTPAKEIVWKYTNPVQGSMVSPGGFAAPPPPGQILTPVVRDFLGVTAEQRTVLDQIQKNVDARLDKVLTAGQKQQLTQKPPSSPGGQGPAFQAGMILPNSEQSRLKLSAEQKKDLAALQKDMDGRLAKVLTDDQKKQIKGGFAFGGPPPGGGPGGPGGGRPQPGRLVPPFVEDALQLTEQQKQRLNEFQKEADRKLDGLFNAEQEKQFKEPQVFGGSPQPGQFLSAALQARLKLSGDQKKELQKLQKEADVMLAKLLTDVQKKRFKEWSANHGRGGPGGPGGTPGLGGPPNMRPGSALFRAYRYAANYPGLAGKELTAGKTIEDLEKKELTAKGTR